MNLQQYWAIIEDWKTRYGNGRVLVRQYNPAHAKLACRRCGKIKKKMSRHHKANDFFFAQLMPEIYAARYIQFLDKDIDKLCNFCHKSWHKYLSKKIRIMYAEAMMTFPNMTYAEKKEWCDKWKNKCLQWYEAWVKKPIKPSKKK